MSTIQEVVDTVVANAKTGEWLNCTFHVVGWPTGIGIKAYGNWVQRVECCGVVGGTPMGIKTRKAFRESLTQQLQSIARTLGIESGV